MTSRIRRLLSDFLGHQGRCGKPRRARTADAASCIAASERLENRTLLSALIFQVAGDSNLTVEVFDDAGVDTIRVRDQIGNSQQVPLADLSGSILIQSTGADAALTIDNSAIVINVPIEFELNGGSGSLIGPTGGAEWTVDGASRGTVTSGTDQISFAGVDRIVTGDAADTIRLDTLAIGQLSIGGAGGEVSGFSAFVATPGNAVAVTALGDGDTVFQASGSASGTLRLATSQATFTTDLEYTSGADVSLLASALGNIANLAEALGNNAPRLSQTLPILGNRSVGELLGLGAHFNDVLARPAESVTDSMTVDEIARTLASAGISPTVTFSETDLTVDFNVDFAREFEGVGLALGIEIEEWFVADSLVATVDTTVDWRFSINVDDTGAVLFDLGLEDFAFTASIDEQYTAATQNFQGHVGTLGMEAGFVDGQQSVISLSGLAVSLDTSTMLGSSLVAANLETFNPLTLLPSGSQANVVIDLHARPSGDLSGTFTETPRIRFADNYFDDLQPDDVLDSTDTTLVNWTNFSTIGLEDFFNSNPQTMRTQLEQFSLFLSFLDAGALEQGSLPVALTSSRVGDVYDLQRAFTENVLSAVTATRVDDNTSLADLNFGFGVRTVSGEDLEIQLGDGTRFSVDLSGISNISQLRSAIQTASGKTEGEFNVVLEGDALVFADFTLAPTGAFSIRTRNGSPALADLGLGQRPTGQSIGGIGPSFIRAEFRFGVNFRTLQQLKSILDAEAAISVGTLSYDVARQALGFPLSVSIAANSILGDLTAVPSSEVFEVKDQLGADNSLIGREIILNSESRRITGNTFDEIARSTKITIDRAYTTDPTSGDAFEITGNYIEDVVLPDLGPLSNLTTTSQALLTPTGTLELDGLEFLFDEVGSSVAETTFVSQLNAGRGINAVLGTRASGLLTITGNALDGETVTIGTRTYTFRNSVAAAGDVLIGVDATETAANLAATINGTGIPGTTYGTGTTLHADVFAMSRFGATFVEAKLRGPLAALISTSETSANAEWLESELTGGEDFDDLRIQLFDGTAFTVDLDHDPTEVPLAVTLVAGDDLQITLSNGDTFGVDLNGATHVGDVVRLIQAAFDRFAESNATVASDDFEIRVIPSRGSIQIIDYTDPMSALPLAITQTAGSTAATDLNLDGVSVAQKFEGREGFAVEASFVTLGDLLSVVRTTWQSQASDDSLFEIRLNGNGDSLEIVDGTGSGLINAFVPVIRAESAELVITGTTDNLISDLTGYSLHLTWQDPDDLTQPREVFRTVIEQTYDAVTDQTTLVFQEAWEEGQTPPANDPLIKFRIAIPTFVSSLNDSGTDLGLNLVGSGRQQGFLETSLIDGLAFGFTLDAGDDLRVTLRDGTNVAIDLADFVTQTEIEIADATVIEILEFVVSEVGVSDLSLGADANTGEIALLDFTTGGGTFTVTQLGNSNIEDLLGVQAAFENGDDYGDESPAQINLSGPRNIQVLRGGVIHGDEPGQHVGLNLSSPSRLITEVALDTSALASGLDVQGQSGPFEVASSASIAGSIQSTTTSVHTFLDPGNSAGSQFATFTELSTTSTSRMADVAGEPVTTFTLDAIDLQLGLDPVPTATTLSGYVDNVAISAADVDLRDATELEAITLQALSPDPGNSANLADLLNTFTQTSIDDVIFAIDGVSSYLANLQHLAELNANENLLAFVVPGLGVSVAELLDLGAAFDNLLTAIAEQRPATIQQLEATIFAVLGNQFGSAATLGLLQDGDVLKIEFQGLRFASSTFAVPFNLDLRQIVSEADLSANKLTAAGMILDGDPDNVIEFIDATISGLLNIHLGLRESVVGTSSNAGVTTTLVDANQQFDTFPDLVGREVEVIAGTGSGQRRIITSVDSATQISVDRAWTTPLGADSQYVIRRSFLYGAADGSETALSVDLDADQDNLDFRTLMRSTQVGVISDVSAETVSTFAFHKAGDAAAPAKFTAMLASDVDASAAADSTTTALDAEVSTTLYLEYPPELLPPTEPIAFSIADLSSGSSSSYSLSGPPVDDDLGTVDLLENLDGFRIGFDQLLKELDAAIRAKLFSDDTATADATENQLPLVGNQLEEAIDFIRQIREKMSDNLATESARLTPELARLALFEALGPGGLNWMIDTSGDGIVSIADVQLHASPTLVTFDVGLQVEETTTAYPVDFETTLPALGLELDTLVEVTTSFLMPNLQLGFSTGSDGTFLGLRTPTTIIQGTADDPSGEFNSLLVLEDAEGGFSEDLEGLQVEIVSGTGAGQIRTIDTVLSDSFLGLDSGWDIAPDSTSQYAISSPDFVITVDARLPESGPGNEISGRLGIMPMRVRGDVGGQSTFLTGFYRVNLVEGANENGRLSVVELMREGTDAIGGGFTGIADLNLQLTTDLPSGTEFPPLRLILSLPENEPFTYLEGVESAPASIHFNAIEFELVGFMRDFMGPSITRFVEAMEPVEGVVDFVNTAFPFFSLIFGSTTYTNAAGANGGDNAIGNFAGAFIALERIVDGGDPLNSDPLSGLFLGDAPAKLRDLTPIAELSGEAWLDLGSFTVSLIDARGPATSANGTPNTLAVESSDRVSYDDLLLEIDDLAKDTSDPAHEAAKTFLVTQALPGPNDLNIILGGTILTGINLEAGSSVIDYLILQDGMAFDILLGDFSSSDQLFTYDTPNLLVGLQANIPFSPQRLFENYVLTGSDRILGKLFPQDSKKSKKGDSGGGGEQKAKAKKLPAYYPYLVIAWEAKADFAMAFDASGLTAFAATRNPDDIRNGFYLDDLNGVAFTENTVGAPDDPDQSRILGGIGLGFAIEASTPGVAGFSAEAGIEGILFVGETLNLIDPNDDGKVYLYEYQNQLNSGSEFDSLKDKVFEVGIGFEVRVDIYLNAGIFVPIIGSVEIIDFRYNVLSIVTDSIILNPDAEIDTPDLTDLTRTSEISLSTEMSAFLQELGLSTSTAKVLYLNGPDGLDDGSSSNQVLYVGQRTKNGETTYYVSNSSWTDVTIPEAGYDVVIGFAGSGDDEIYISPDLQIPVIIVGGGGDDTLVAGGAPALLIGEGGHDNLVGGLFADWILGGSGNDVLFGNDGDDKLIGGLGSDIIYGWRGRDLIYGDGEVENSSGDSDTIDGGIGDDDIFGGAGPDEIDGNLGHDFIAGELGEDIIRGGDGRDEIHGGDGADEIEGGLGNDTIDGGDGDDQILAGPHRDDVQGGEGRDTIDGEGATDEVRGGAGNDVITAKIGNDFLDGEDGSDDYLLGFQGGTESALVTVLDTGGSSLDTDRFFATGTVFDDEFLVRAATNGTAFVALLNTEDAVERINYTGVERIQLNGSFGDDFFAVDDTAAEITINGDSGSDTFQVGQIFRSERTEVAANVDPGDVFATIETTRGFLSNGISFPMTINGGSDNDRFVVYHNKAVLTLNGESGDDQFEVKAFALKGSQEPQRERTDISGGAGADLVEYAVNAPVNIDGGDGTDILVAIGTEFGDDFVITRDGVFGAGLNVNFTNIEKLRIDGAEGDDRFFIQSTDAELTTELFGGLGNDTFNVSGDTPPVVSNDLLGHSGIITHDAISLDPLFDGQALFGVSANVADNDEPGIAIRPSDGSTIVTEGSAANGGVADDYQVVLTVAPLTNVFVRVLAPLPTNEDRELRSRAFGVLSTASGAVTAADGTSVTLMFTPDNWYMPQTVVVFSDDRAHPTTGDPFRDPAGILTRPELGDAADFTFDDSAAEGLRFGFINHTVSAGTDQQNGDLGISTVDSLIGAKEVLAELTGMFALDDTVSVEIGGTDVTITVDAEAATDLDRGGLARALADAINLASLTAPVRAVALQETTLSFTNTGAAGDEVVVTLGTEEFTYTLVAADSDAESLAANLAEFLTSQNISGITATANTLEGGAGSVVIAEAISTSGPRDLTVTITSASLSDPTLSVRSIVSLVSDDANSTTQDETDFFVSTEGTGTIALVLNGGNGTSTFVESSTGFSGSVIGRRIDIVDGPGIGQSRFVVADDGAGLLTVDRAWNSNDLPDATSRFQIVIDDALVGTGGQSTTEGGSDDPIHKFTDATAPFPTTGAGVTGRVLQIVGGAGIGQQRLILSNTESELTLNGPWSTPVDKTSIYRIESYDGLAVPSVRVQINDNDQLGVIVAETGDGTDVIEGGDGDQTGEQDTIDVRLSSAPTTGTVTVALTNSDGDLTFSSNSLTFSSSDATTFQPVTVTATDDSDREGFHSGLIEFALSGGDGDMTVSVTDEEFTIPDDESVFFVALSQIPDAATVDVQVDGTNLAASRYEVDRNRVLFLDTTGNPQMRTGSITVSYDYLVAGFSSAATPRIVVGINDDEAPTVVVRESGGSTDLIEFDSSVGTSTIARDSYELVLSGEPTEDVTVVVTPQVTKTTRTGGIRHDLVQVQLSSSDSRFVNRYLLTVTGTVETGDVYAIVSGNTTATYTVQDSDTTLADIAAGLKSVLGDLGLANVTGDDSAADGTLIVSVGAAGIISGSVTTNGTNTDAALSVSLLDQTVTFSSTNWDEPVTVDVAAIDDAVVDGGDTKVFAPGPNSVSNILGPVVIEGGGGEGSLNTVDPLLLPGETNIKASTGDILSIDNSGSTTMVTVSTNDLQSILSDVGVTTVAELVDKTIEITALAATTDPAVLALLGQFRRIVAVTVDGSQTTLELNEPFFREEQQYDVTLTGSLDPGDEFGVLFDGVAVSRFVTSETSLAAFARTLATAINDAGIDGTTAAATGAVITITTSPRTEITTAVLADVGTTDATMSLASLPRIPLSDAELTEYAITAESLNFFVDESTQVDFFFLHDQDSPADSDGLLTPSSLTGLNMGPAGAEGFGITYGDLEVMEINLGTGVNNFRVQGTAVREDGFETWTMLNTGDVADPNNPPTTDDTIIVTLVEHETNTSVGHSVITAASDTATGTATIQIDGFPLTASPTRDGLNGQLVRTGDGQEREIIKTQAQSEIVLSGTIETGDRFEVQIGDQTASYTVNLSANPGVAAGLADAINALAIPGVSAVSTTNRVQLITDPSTIPTPVVTNSMFNDVSIDVAQTTALLTVNRIWENVPVAGELVDIIKPADGRIAVNAQGGDDVIDATGSTQQIIAFGGLGNDTITGGEGADILFGDRGRVDFYGDLDADTSVRPIVTRVGTAPAPITGAATAPFDNPNELHDIQANFPVPNDATSGFQFDTGLIGLFVDINNGTAFGQEPRLITGNGAQTLFIAPEFTETLDATSEYRISTVPEDQTDLVNRQANFLITVDDALGGDDVIHAGSGDDQVFGGAGADTIDGEMGDDVLFGDAGVIERENTSANTTELDRIRTKSVSDGADDTISGDAGADIAFGGAGEDHVDGNLDNDVLFGDFGQVDLEAGTISRILTTDAIAGASDVIHGDDTNSGNDIILAGANSSSDVVDAGDGANIVIGDFGEILFNVDGDLSDIDSIQSTDVTLGGEDDITTGAETDIIIGGVGGDTIDAGEGSNLVIGDSGSITAAIADTPRFGDQPLTLGQINNNVPAADVGGNTGGDDEITTGAGADIVLGGLGADTVTAGNGDNIILGDHGSIAYDTTGSQADLHSITSSDFTAGGDDTITSTNGDDIILGGAGGDTIHAGDGANIVLGDHGIIDYVGQDADPSDIDQVVTISPENGGADTITTLSGNDFILGGGAGDTVHAGSGNDLIFGDFGLISGDVDAGQLPLKTMTPPFVFTSIDTTHANGGDDTIHGEAGEDIILGQQGSDIVYAGDDDDDVIGGHNVSGGHDAGDRLDGGAGFDVVVGDNATIDRRDDTINPRMRTLAGTTIYGTEVGVNDGESLQDGTFRDNPRIVGTSVERDIVLLDHADDTSPTLFGNDVIAGGADDDEIFGQLGDDTIQGDGSIDESASAGRDSSTGLLIVDPSVEATTDGDDYVEGGGGNDVIFGNLGQDELVGGSSTLYALTSAALRPDGADLIFGGAGNRIERLNDGSGLHAEDADTIAGDNANIYRLVSSSSPTANGFLSFNYDNYGESRTVIPRAVELIDYTPGGLDFKPVAANDLGDADEIHGESGDDTVYGMVGGDVLFGDGQDDDLIGGWGHDWISGGNGIDGVLGDDGRISTSRNDGNAEPHFGIDGFASSELDTEIATGGKIQQATINVTGELKKTVNLTPFNVVDPTSGSQNPHFNPLHADDIIFGGLGMDFLHGGAGDDAISGAEALDTTAAMVGTTLFANGFLIPANPGDILGFAADATRSEEFFLYDEFNPLNKILVNGAEFLLNFNTTESVTLPNGSPATITDDGADRIFGDLGNDWIVGGTGLDHAYGGYGNDLLNMDDDLSTSGGLNNTPDTDPTYADIAFGGAGRDVLIANTEPDRLIDWSGDFNSYLVPFAPFGLGTVSRSIQPQLKEYLYDLSESDGADPTRSADTGASATRNGEPEGELGLVTREDVDWQDQTGAPGDPQPGNVPGGKRDVKKKADFNNGAPQGFFIDSGLWSTSGGRLEVAPATLGTDAVSVLHLEDGLPTYYEVAATVNGGKPTGGLKSNAYLIFDYQSAEDFKYAGVNISTDKIEIGYRDSSGWHNVVQTSSQLKANRDYQVLLSVNGTSATLIVDGDDLLTHVFDARVDSEGITYGLNSGLLGLGANNSVSRIDNVAVQVLPAELTFQIAEVFVNGDADLFTNPSGGNWQINGGEYVGDSAAEAPALSLVDLSQLTGSDPGTLRLNGNAFLELTAQLTSSAVGGIAFDVNSSGRFKFAAIEPSANQIVIGHYTASDGWAIDAATTRNLSLGTATVLKLTAKGSTVTVEVDGQFALTHAFNAALSDGAFGLLSGEGSTSFNFLKIATDDAQLEDLTESDLSSVSLVPASSLDPYLFESLIESGQAEENEVFWII